jgi:hypothetical protein
MGCIEDTTSESPTRVLRTGAEGFQNIFPRRRFPIYLIDQLRRGRAEQHVANHHHGHARRAALVRHLPARHLAELLPGVQFSQVPEALNQFFRQMVTNTGPYDPQGEYGGCFGIIQ